MNDPELFLRKNLTNQTIADCKMQDKQYEKLDMLWSELDDHLLNGRYRQYDKVFTEIMKLNREITVTENRCRSRLGLKKL